LDSTTRTLSTPGRDCGRRSRISTRNLSRLSRIRTDGSSSGWCWMGKRECVRQRFNNFHVDRCGGWCRQARRRWPLGRERILRGLRQPEDHAKAEAATSRVFGPRRSSCTVSITACRSGSSRSSSPATRPGSGKAACCRWLVTSSRRLVYQSSSGGRAAVDSASDAPDRSRVNPRPYLGGVAPFQSSTFRLGTRWNSVVLCVTSVSLRAFACPAMSTSYGPIGVPFDAR
jgi:hypothetical protein